MPLYATDALILRTYTLGESDRIVVFLTRDRGKKRGVAKNARQSRRRFGGALEPLTCGRVEYVEHERRDLVSLRFVEPSRSPLTAGGEPALAHAAYFAELIDECAPDADPNETLYRLGASIVDALAGGVAVEPLARYFEYWLLRLQGVFDHGRPLSPAARAFLDAARVTSPAGIGGVAVAPAALRELEGVLGEMIGGHLEKTVKSARVLRELDLPGSPAGHKRGSE
jgi:Recombination protein O N terminal/Recombination protein O C terminal